MPTARTKSVWPGSVAHKDTDVTPPYRKTNVFYSLNPPCICRDKHMLSTGGAFCSSLHVGPQDKSPHWITYPASRRHQFTTSASARPSNSFTLKPLYLQKYEAHANISIPNKVALSEFRICVRTTDIAIRCAEGQ